MIQIQSAGFASNYRTGFIAKFHVQALLSVRHVAITGVYGPTEARREAIAKDINGLELGPCQAFASLQAMLTSGEVDAAWILRPTTRGSTSCGRFTP